MLDTISATYKQATQIASTMYEISESLNSTTLMHRSRGDAIVVYPDEPSALEIAETKNFEFISSYQKRFSELREKLLHDLQEFQSLSQQIQDPYIILSRRELRELEPFDLGELSMPSWTINHPMLSVGLRTAEWANNVRLFLQSLGHKTSLSDEDLNMRTLLDECPYSKEQHIKLADRIPTEHDIVIKAWQSISNAGEAPMKQDEIKEEEKIHDLWEQFRKNGGPKNVLVFLETKFDGWQEDLKEFMRSQWNEEKNKPLKYKEDGTQKQPKSDDDVLRKILNTGLQQKKRGGRKR